MFTDVTTSQVAGYVADCFFRFTVKNSAVSFLLLVCAIQTATAGEFTGRVVAVLDGDTVLVQRGARGGSSLKVRLAGIDAPEKEQPFGEVAKRSLSDLVLKRQVRVNGQATDDYGRLVAHLESDGRSVNEEQVRRGMAWEYSRRHDSKVYVALQYEAQQARRGLWAQASPTPPWQWRKAHASAQPPQRGAARAYTCGTKRYCAQMTSCGEANFYLAHCGVKTLDSDGNGVPCENLCAARK